MVVAPGGPLVGRISVPGDKSISHRVLMLAALADGASTVRGLSDGGDVACTRRIIEALGADVVDAGDGTISIRGGRLEAVDHPLDVGNSGTGIRLLAGLLAGLPFRSVLDGDASIRRRPMDRVLDPLRLMGASLRGRDGQPLAPLEIRGGGLRGIEYRLPVASAQVKGCVLFAGLSAEGPTTVLEDRPSRAHTEELMMAFGITLDAGSDGDLRSVTVQPGRPTAFDHDVAGDPSQAAFWAVAASILPGSEVVVANVYAGPARSGFVDVLSRMGADITHDPTTGDLTVRHSGLTGTVVTADEVPGLVDEVPILAVAAACADGETTFEGVGELRVKESDRLATVESELGRMGADVRVDGDTLVVRGSALTGAEVDSHHDHRIAMACAVAALVADGPTTIHGWDAVATSYPGFVADLDLLRGGT
ncbi:MAG TPA: 3-phosphoshikimate 1-carboxyvinyltransferase [Acidimicrobiaceae bacterium]|nr:3-phosphoshikimate 1-carboxyvinyltransferase [Acidimicrobiaceae bacterium]